MSWLSRNTFSGAAMLAASILPVAAEPSMHTPGPPPPPPLPELKISALHDVGAEQTSKHPLPLTVLAIDISSSLEADAAFKVRDALSTEQAAKIMDTSGPQIIAIVVWADRAILWEDTYHIVRGEQASDLFEEKLSVVASNVKEIRAGIVDGTDAKNLLKYTGDVIAEIKAQGNAVASTKVIVVGDGKGYGPARLVSYMRSLGTEHCTQISFVSSSVPGSYNIEEFGKAVNLAARDPENIRRPLMCTDNGYPMAVPQSTYDYFVDALGFDSVSFSRTLAGKLAGPQL